MTRLIIVRHGQSVTNTEKVFTGQLDSPLTELGMAQAKKTADYIAENFKIDKIYSSDLIRCMYTAGAIGDRLGLEVISDKNLREIDGGIWQGMRFDDIIPKYPEEYRLWKTDMGKFKAIDGESINELYDRVTEEFLKIARENDGKNVAVVSHAVAIRAVQCMAKGKSVGEIQNIPYVSNSSVTIAEFVNGILTFTDTDCNRHLEGMVTALPSNI